MVCAVYGHEKVCNLVLLVLFLCMRVEVVFAHIMCGNYILLLIIAAAFMLYFTSCPTC